MAHAAVLDTPSAAARGQTDAGRVADPATRSHRVLWVALGIFALVAALGLRAHTLWFDEMQAWNIARASGSLGDLVHNLRYEGHPILWYLPLYVLTRVTGNPHSMQVLQLVIATSTAALVLFRAPFRVSLRVGLVAGYFFAFEYGVLSRSYGLAALLTVTTLVLVARPAPRWGWATAALVALAFTSLPGAVLALAFAGAVVLDRGSRPARGRVGFVIGGVVAALVVVVTCIPPDDFGNLTPGIGDSSRFGSGLAVRIASSLSATWRALVPVPASIGEWNSNVLDRQAGAVWVQAALAVVIVGVVLGVLWRSPFARRLWWIGSFGLFVFFSVVTRPEAARHAGFAFLLLVASAWLAGAPPGDERAEPAARDARGPLGRVLVVVIVAQIVAMLAVYPSASLEDFSRDRVLADTIREAGLDDAIVSAQDWDATTIGGYLGKPVFSIVRNEMIEFLVTDERQERGVARLDAPTVTCVALRVANQRRRPVAVVVEGVLRGYRPLITRGASVYRIKPGKPSPGSCPR